MPLVQADILDEWPRQLYWHQIYLLSLMTTNLTLGVIEKQKYCAKEIKKNVQKNRSCVNRIIFIFIFVG